MQNMIQKHKEYLMYPKLRNNGVFDWKRRVNYCIFFFFFDNKNYYSGQIATGPFS